MQVDFAKMAELPQMEIEVIHHETDGMYSKEMRIPAGVAVGKHVHDYSHFSFLAKGNVRLIQGDDEQTLSAPAIVLVKAGVEHTIIAESDAVWFCTHAL